MNNVTRLAFIAFLFFFSFGCANNPGQHSAQKEAVNPQLAAEDSLRDVVLEIPDAVRPKRAKSTVCSVSCENGKRPTPALTRNCRSNS